MKIRQILISTLATLVVFALGSSVLEAQAARASSEPASIAVSIALDKNHVSIGESPWAVLTVKNLSDHIVSLHDLMVRIHVLGEKGERPMTRVQRTLTGKFLPGEAPLRVDENALWTITPGVASSHRYEVSYFYNIGEPDKYRVYMEVVDPTTRKRLRTKTVTFEIVAPDK